jgi:hypothetical protein
VGCGIVVLVRRIVGVGRIVGVVAEGELRRQSIAVVLGSRSLMVVLHIAVVGVGSRRIVAGVAACLFCRR